MPAKIDEQDHYEILALPSVQSSRKQLAEQDVKLAYRRALLLHHPDKSASETTKPPTTKPTVDQITIAYKTLIDPTARSEYDRLLALQSPSTGLSSQVSHPGLETVDLDDLLYDEAQGIWYRGCRCGKERAYVVTEEELENNAEYGELVTGCQGCNYAHSICYYVTGRHYPGRGFFSIPTKIEGASRYTNQHLEPRAARQDLKPNMLDYSSSGLFFTSRGKLSIVGWSAEEVSVSAREVEKKLVRDIMQHAGLTRPAYRYENAGHIKVWVG